MNIFIKPGTAIGTAVAPPSKSYAHRMMLCAALADGTSIIHGVRQSEDALATLDCISELGAECSLQDDVLTVKGVGGRVSGSLFPCRESGSTLRFIIPIAMTGGRDVSFTGSERLMERGVSVYDEVFRGKGVSLNRSAEGLTASGQLIPGEYKLRGDVSSQFVTGLLFALPLLDGDSVLRVLPPVESRGYIDITLDVLKDFGVKITEGPKNVFTVPGRQKYRCREAEVEGDWSNAAFLYALNHMGGNVTVTGVSQNSLQGDRICTELFHRLDTPGEVIDISDCPDLGPVLFAVAAAKHGAVFTGTRRLRIKESDRAQVMAGELSRFGIEVEVHENSVNILPGNLTAPVGPADGHNDHRIVMSMAVLMSKVGGWIKGAEAVSKSFPDFFSVLSNLGLEVENGV